MASARPTRWVIYGEPVLGVLAISVVASTLATIGAFAHHAPNDFTVFLESARWMREGADLYQRPLRPGPGYNLNPPATILLFVPFSFLTDAAALYLWTGLGVAAYVVAAFWIARTVSPGRTASIAGAIFLSQAAIMSLLLGQMGALMMLLLTAAWVADREDRPLLAGGLLGVAIAAKPFLVACAAYALWRRSRALAGGIVVGGASLTGLGLIAAGVGGLQSWLGALRQISWSAHVGNGSLYGMLGRTLAPAPEILHATPIVVRPHIVQPLWWMGVSLICAVTVVTLLRTRNRDVAWAILLIGSLLVSPLGWVYYATIFVGPLVAVARGAARMVQLVIVAGCACLYVPPTTVPRLGAFGAAALGSIYTWGLLLLFAGAALGDRPRVRRTVLP